MRDRPIPTGNPSDCAWCTEARTAEWARFYAGCDSCVARHLVASPDAFNVETGVPGAVDVFKRRVLADFGQARFAAGMALVREWRAVLKSIRKVAA